MRKHLTFITVFFLYWKAHRIAYAARVAHGIAYRGLPF
jgi:hypothetical protein